MAISIVCNLPLLHLTALIFIAAFPLSFCVRLWTMAKKPVPIWSPANRKDRRRKKPIMNFLKRFLSCVPVVFLAFRFTKFLTLSVKPMPFNRSIVIMSPFAVVMSALMNAKNRYFGFISVLLAVVSSIMNFFRLGTVIAICFCFLLGGL